MGGSSPRWRWYRKSEGVAWSPSRRGRGLSRDLEADLKWDLGFRPRHCGGVGASSGAGQKGKAWGLLALLTVLAFFRPSWLPRLRVTVKGSEDGASGGTHRRTLAQPNPRVVVFGRPGKAEVPQDAGAGQFGEGHPARACG